MAGKKKGGGGGAKKKGGGGTKKSAWVQQTITDEPLLPREAVNPVMTIQVRGVVWQFLNFTKRVPAGTRIFELGSMIMERHGGSVRDLTLYKDEVFPRNLLCDQMLRLCDVEFSDAAADADRVIYYDFAPRKNDCPLLLNPPNNLKIEAVQRAEADAKARKAAKLAELKQSATQPSLPAGSIRSVPSASGL